MPNQAKQKKSIRSLLISNLCLLAVVSFAKIPAAFANEDLPRARIIYGNFGTKEISAKSKDRVKGSLRDLEILSDAEDLGIVFACYDGATDAVCDLLKIAVKEENDKNENQGKHKFHLECKTDDFGAISTKIKSENGKYIYITKIYQCK